MRLIDADVLKTEIRSHFPDLPMRCEINNIINSAPTVDGIIHAHWNHY